MRNTLDEHGGKTKRKVFALDEYSGHRYFEIREYYLKKGDDEWKPTRKGVTLNKDTYEILKGVIALHDERIMDWLGSDYIPDDVTRYEEAQHVVAKESRYTSHNTKVSEYEEPRDSQFFHTMHEGGLVHLKLNRSHPVHELLSSLDDDGLQLIYKIIHAYSRAKALLSDSPAFDVETLFMHLEQDWSKYLKDLVGDLHE